MYEGAGKAIGSAQFIDPDDEIIHKTTKELNAVISLDFNTKRSVINNIVEYEIKPLFENR